MKEKTRGGSEEVLGYHKHIYLKDEGEDSRV
jgi:hypothetical protein